MNEKTREEVERWIMGDENGSEMLKRVCSVRPFILPPPLHRVPLRVGNVLELVGPSPSAKTQILIQTAITCILPKHWNGIHYGGFDHLVLFIDLDSRFDIMRFSQLLIHRIHEPYGEAAGDYDKSLYDLCMTRFLYVRCSDSFQFLQTLKTLNWRLDKEKEVHGVSVHLLMIDSIGTFHWMDRASMFLSLKENNRKKLFLQSVSEAVVQDIKKLLQVHPMLVIATKSVIFWNKHSSASIEVKGSFMKNNWEERSLRNVTRNYQHFQYREYMPSVWQSFVTHRILIRSSDDHSATSNCQNSSFFLLEWLLPKLSFSDTIVVKDAGVFVDS
ncbi:DNA repair protein XRCC2 homolog [Cicer arietinum]|uniref:DNA repair protein XRCC2 homolog n=1 Tax=Cicer arietinum TaxID=3827 RepID=A0A1S2YJK7_CICAR|nr:DNA repair protein XRCC2 homolog [Cicer arietinum]XP_004505754.1 DNA repair protein XRCC2 homolog [Cicer arietinum]XP_004505755.1 DNA repair protein XRCC2 homolog [Cicer arietinum]